MTSAASAAVSPISHPARPASATATGNSTATSIDPTDASLSTRATRNQTAARPSTISGWSTASMPPAVATPLPP